MRPSIIHPREIRSTFIRSSEYAAPSSVRAEYAAPLPVHRNTLHLCPSIGIRSTFVRPRGIRSTFVRPAEYAAPSSVRAEYAAPSSVRAEYVAPSSVRRNTQYFARRRNVAPLLLNLCNQNTHFLLFFSDFLVQSAEAQKMRKKI